MPSPGLKPAGTPDAAQDFFESPGFQWNYAQQQQNQQQQNQQQQAYNQIAQQQAATNQARLGLEQEQFGFNLQNRISDLLSQILGQSLQNLYAQQTGARTTSDLASRLLDTQYNVERTGLMDQLRILQAQQDLNRIIDTPGSRARRLIGG